MRSQEQEDLITEELSELHYYHGVIDSSKAVELLRRERPGTFLLRQSPNKSHQSPFIISVIKNRDAKRTDIYHFSVLGQPGKYYANKSVTFKRISFLVEYYETNDYENHLDISHIRLMHPLRNKNYVSAYAYAGVDDRFDALLTHLRQLDTETNEEYCDCGMRIKDSELPNGWMLHQVKSDRPGENPMIFFQNNSLNLTQWDLPKGIWSQLTATQKRLINERGVASSQI